MGDTSALINSLLPLFSALLEPPHSSVTFASAIAAVFVLLMMFFTPSASSKYSGVTTALDKINISWGGIR